MNIAELKAEIADLPDDMEIILVTADIGNDECEVEGTDYCHDDNQYYLYGEGCA